VTETVRGSDLVGRIDDDSFAFLLPNCEAKDAKKVLLRIQDHILEHPIKLESDETVPMTFSAGISGLSGKVKYMLTPYAIIDLLAILPYLLLNAGFNSSFIRSLRLLRIFRLFRIKKYAIFVKLMKDILNDMKEELLVLLFFTIVILVMLSFIIFDIEHEAQPKVFTNIFQTLWWSVATLTTVGYGDMYPITPAGKLITGIISILGIAFIAIPGGMFASKFTEAISEYRELQNRDDDHCCHCGSNRVEEMQNAELIVDGENKAEEPLKKCCDCGFIFMIPRKEKCSSMGIDNQ